MQVWAMGCEPLPCLEPNPKMRIRFFSEAGDSLAELSPVIDSFMMRQGGEILIKKGKETVTELVIPMPVTGDPAFWLVWIDTARTAGVTSYQKDSIRFSYKPKAKYISEECGFRYFYEQLETTQPNGLIFQKSIVTKSIIDSGSKAHVQIFL